MQKLRAKLVAGYQVASGQTEDSPYPDGSIKLQEPFFKDLSLDLSSYYSGTLNLDISPHSFSVIQPKYCFKGVNWFEKQSEDFSFCDAKINFKGNFYEGLIYFPHPDTKPQHHHSDQIIEVLMPFIEAIQYGDEVDLFLNPLQLHIK